MIVPMWAKLPNPGTGLMNKLRITGILLLLMTVLTCKAEAGNLNVLSPPDSSFIFINGWQYHLTPANQGHPFLNEKSWKFGSLDSELGEIEEVLMNYDTYRDELVVQQIIRGEPGLIVLNPLYINSFQLDGMSFVNTGRMGFEADPGFQGYFRILYGGDLYLLRKYSKNLEETGSTAGSSFEPETRNFLVYQGDFYEIRGNSSIYAVFPRFKKEIRSYLRSNRIILRSTSDIELISLVKYCEQLIREEE